MSVFSVYKCFFAFVLSDYSSFYDVVNVGESDYGDYVCHGVNTQGDVPFTLQLLKPGHLLILFTVVCTVPKTRSPFNTIYCTCTTLETKSPFPVRSPVSKTRSPFTKVYSLQKLGDQVIPFTLWALKIS